MGFDARSTAEEVTAGLDLSGRRFLVTGCNSGLGHETIRVLASRGAEIVGLARTEEKARAAMADLGIEGRAVACDLSDLGSVRQAVAALQGVDNVFDISWVEGVSYADVFMRNEKEQSAYNFEHSDAEALFDQFNKTFNECARLAELGLALPAYDQAIATSHTFNLLDARGAISVAERAQYIRRIRDLACRCCEAWVAGEEVAQ